MPWLKLNFLLSLFLSFNPSAFAQNSLRFRTPARLYGSAYSVKMTVRREGFEYDIPVWVKPDQKFSSLDRVQMADLGWIHKDLKIEEAAFSGEVLHPPQFQNAKSEWAYVPEFPKSCCYGVIGQDILKQYRVRFDPNPPAHLEWTRLDSDHRNKKIPETKLSHLFSVRGVSANIGRKKIDLSSTPYVLDLSEGGLDFEDTKPSPSYALKGPLFHYHFTPPSRNIVIDSLSPTLKKPAKLARFTSGISVTQINQHPVAGLSRFEIDEFLMGKKSQLLTLTWNKGGTTYDFEKNEFTAFEKIQTPPRRH